MKYKRGKTNKTITGTNHSFKKSKTKKKSLGLEEKKIQTILETIEDGYYEIDLSGNFTFFNDALCRIHGRSRKELMGLNYRQYLNEENLEKVFQAYNKVYETGVPNKELRLQFTRDDETEIYIEISISLQKDSSGKSIGFRGIVRDVTERVLAEESLKQSDEKYRLLAEHMKDAVWITDLNLKVTYVSPSAVNILGWTEEEFKQLLLNELFTPESFKKAIDFYSVELPKALAASPDYVLDRTIELEFVSKKGQTVCGECMFTLMRDDVGKPVSILGEARTITERKQIENKLLVSENNFRNSLDDSPLGVRISTVEGETIYANKAILDIYGYDSIEELKSKRLKQRYTPESYAEWKLRKAKRLQSELGPSEEYDVSIVRKDGKIRHLHVFRKEIFWDGKKQFLVIYNDVTLRRQAEEKILQNEEKYRNILENMQEGYFEVDLTGNFTFCNDSLCSIHRRSRDEMLGLNNREYMDQENTKKVFEAFSRVYKTGEALPEIDYQIIRKDGARRYIEASISLLKDATGQPIGFRGVTRDVTERKQAEALLKQSEDKYRLLADHMKDQVWLMDLNMSILYVSPSVERITGYSSDEIKKLPLDKLLTPESLKKAIEFTSFRMPKAFKTSSKDTIFRTFELEFILKDGQTVWGECSFNFIRDDNGKAVSILGEARDITERKMAEEKLHQSESRYRTILEDIQEGYFEIDLAGKFTFFNDTVCRVMGYSREELMGMNSRQYADQEELKHVFQAYNTVYTTGEPIKELVWKITRKDGTQRYIEGFISLLKDSSSKPIGFRGIARDITERKEAEDKLQQTLESLKKAVGTTIQVLVSALESRDPYTAGHQSRSADLACAIAAEMGLDQDQIQGIRMAGIIHDIGKLSVPTEILAKPTKLTNLEFSLIKVHPQSGYEMLKDIESPWPLAEIVHQHHERINGSGYPRNLKGDEILIEARIMAVADVVEAMASHRPYRASLGIETALEEIEQNRGILYDEVVVDACLTLFRAKNYQFT